MKSIKIGNKSIGGEHDSIFVIAEIGQNHQGNLDIAKQMISQAKEIGCDCVKFQKSFLSAKFTKSALDRSYQNPNSWGETYGEHKKFLEFNLDQYKELQRYANEVGILFTASAMDEVSLQELMQLNVPFIKIGSGDANNFQLLEMAAQCAIPLIISTGMQTISTIEKIIQIMQTYEKNNFCLLHCISAYPTNPEDAALSLINVFKERFPCIPIGYSGHEEGILISKIAALQGAKVIERHFTMDKTQKGTDHKLSLTPSEFKNLIDFLREMEKSDLKKPMTIENCISFFDAYENDSILIIRQALKDIKTREIFDCEKPCRNKLGKSIVFRRDILKGSTISQTDLAVKVSEPFGISAENLEQFIGLRLKENVFMDDVLLQSHFYEF